MGRGKYSSGMGLVRIGPAPQPLTPHEQAKFKVACPQCHAPIGAKCVGKGKKKVHPARLAAWTEYKQRQAAARVKRQERPSVDQPAVLKGVTRK